MSITLSGVTLGVAAWAGEAELLEPAPAHEGGCGGCSATAEPAPYGEFGDPTVIEKPEMTSIGAPGEATPTAEAAEKDTPAETKDEKKAEEKKAEKPADAKDEKKEGAVEAKPEETPPPPTPTAEEVTKRRQRATEFQSLGEKFFKFPVTGSLYTRYRMRKSGSENDEDMYQFLSMDFGDKYKHFATAHFDARMAADFQHNRKVGRASDVFAGLLDTYDSDVQGRLYTAYMDLNKLHGLEYLRLGRQYNYDTPEVLEFDGARVETDPLFGNHELKFSFYGGLPVHQYESSPAEDLVAGMAAEGRPWKTARMRLDYIHLEDTRRDIRTLDADLVDQSLAQGNGRERNDLVSLTMWQTFRNPDIQLQGRVSVLDGHAREAMARMTYSRPKDQFHLTAAYETWFEEQTRLATEFDPYFQTLAGQEPYHNGTLVVSKGWGEHFWVEGGGVIRRLAYGAHEKEFNHEFGRYYATFEIRNLPIKGLSYSVTGTHWDGRSSAPDTTQVGGEIKYRRGREFESAIGTDYALYKYDFLQVRERDHVRTFYARQRWRPTRWATLDVRYEYERSLDEEYHTVTGSFRFTF